MSLQFYFGPSGAGKSRQLYEEIIHRALKNPRQQYLIIVPDQFTMQTQRDLVLLNERGGIMNIDVLSFGRLTHRILEEVGGLDIPVLDDTGKSLVLQKVAANLKEELPTLGSFLHKQGYIHEVKSAISEFMQYGIGTEDVDKLIAYAGKRGALVQKLKDLKILYKGFVDYIQGNFITTEEKLDVLKRSIKRSHILPGSVVVFDGFTGFTPIQNRVIGELMLHCGEVIVSLTMGEGENPYQPEGEQNLFHMSKKTVADLCKLASENQVGRVQDVFVVPETGMNAVSCNSASVTMSANGGNGQYLKDAVERINELHRFAKSPALQHLERNLFRYHTSAYEKEQREIRLFETSTPKEEVHQVGQEICRLIREKGLEYRDIAVIVGDLGGYAPFVETEFAQMDIPCYIDRTRGIILNPMIEYIKSALGLFEKDFAYEAVFHYLRSGLAGLDVEDVDLLENYCLQTGLRGYRRYSRMFTQKKAGMEEDEEALNRMNVLREHFMNQVEMLHLSKENQVKDYVNALYDFLVQNEVQERLAEFEQEFETNGDHTRAKEYDQIYRLVMELLEQIYALLGEETISLKEFADILEAGFAEIEVGTIPQNVDRVLVGDMERTRLKQVKALFFLGVNDGNIPKSATKGGIISDMDREFLQASELELSPSPRQQMYIQRFYLYLNMTKPSERLYLSYAKVNSSGKSLRPAYLVDVVKKIFPTLVVEYPELRSPLEQIVTEKEGEAYLAKGLREYVEGVLSPEREKDFFALYRVYSEGALQEKRDFFEESAFHRYRESGLSQVVARALYGLRLENSVTRLETYAACAYRHFLQYGLSLKEREQFTFESVDMGNVFHAVLELFSKRLEEHHYNWFTFPKEFGEREVNAILQQYAASYGDTVLYSSARNEYAITRMGRILTRMVETLQQQLKKGSFRPEVFELSFHTAENLDSVNIALSESEKMRLQGRIDRIDVAEESDRVYVKVIDYKSGHRQFDVAALYYGLQLQLVVYMNAAMELESKKHLEKEIIPAALLYYHIDDPSVETPIEPSPEEINEMIAGKLRMSGVVHDDLEIVKRLDGDMETKSDVIPVELKKDGSLSSRSSVLKAEDFQTLSQYVSRKITQIGREILNGNISLNPYEKGSEEACTYCAYKKVCGFELVLPGCRKRKLENLDRAEALQRMAEAACQIAEKEEQRRRRH